MTQMKHGRPIREDGSNDITLVSTAEIDLINEAINHDFRRMAAELQPAAERDLIARLRQYDGYQRITFGRALTGMMHGRTLGGGGDIDFVPCARSSGTDTSFFPRAFTKENYPGLWAAARYSIDLLFNASMQSDVVLVSVYCHRVLVRPGESYGGFTHRDLPSADGRIGTVVWYPHLNTSGIEGAELFSYNVAADVALEELAGRPFDCVFAPSAYRGKVMFFAYPHNFPHGVTPGRNRATPQNGRANSVTDFLEPNALFFVKDMFILAISNRSPVED